jgi:hypothetical protein
MRFLKRTLYVILVLIAAGIAFAVAVSNSDKLATNLAYLECTLDEQGLDKLSPEGASQVVKLTRSKIAGRLRNDWIDGKVLLNWVAKAGTTENGLDPTQELTISTNSYTGWSYSDQAQRTFNRDTLLYRMEAKETYIGEVKYWTTRKCVIIDKKVFEMLRKKSAEATKAKQKI